MSQKKSNIDKLLSPNLVAILYALKQTPNIHRSELCTSPTERRALSALIERGYVRETGLVYGTRRDTVKRVVLTEDGERLFSLFEPIVEELSMESTLRAIRERDHRIYLIRSHRPLDADEPEVEEEGASLEERLRNGPQTTHLMPHDIVIDPMTGEEIEVVAYRKKYGAFPLE